MRLVMMGTGTFAEPTFESLLAGPHSLVGLITQPERPAGHERGSTRQVGKGMKSIALAQGIPVFQPESINTPEGVAGLHAMQPDLLVVAAYGQILSKDVLAVPPKGGINVHASSLPKYRGAAPVAWAIYHGEKQTGVTIIRMSVQLDAGDMLLQEAVDIGPEETAGELEARLAVVGARLAIQAVEQIGAGTARGIKQDKALVSKAPKLTKEHGLIDWSRYSGEVWNQIRAMQPWPSAYTYYQRVGNGPIRIIVHRGRWFNFDDDREGATGPPGKVVVSSSELKVIAGGDSKFLIEELQPAGKRRMHAMEFLRGHPIREGDRLGSESP